MGFSKLLAFNMKFQVIVKSIAPCSCANEGEVEVFLPDFGVTVVCYFIGSVDLFRRQFPLNELRNANLEFWHANWQLTDKRTESLKSNVVGTFSGFELDEDSEKIFKINSIIPVFSDNELGNFELDVPLGSWVESTGQFVIEEVEC